jgi:hypothetical protein
LTPVRDTVRLLLESQACSPIAVIPARCPDVAVRICDASVRLAVTVSDDSLDAPIADTCGVPTEAAAMPSGW